MIVVISWIIIIGQIIIQFAKHVTEKNIWFFECNLKKILF